MTSSQSPETSLINGQLGTNEGSAFSTRHVHVVPIVDRVSSKVTPRHPVAKRCTAADYESISGRNPRPPAYRSSAEAAWIQRFS